MNPLNKDLYGNYRNRKFSDVFDTEYKFGDFITTSPLAPNMKAATVKQLYYLLYAQYGNSTIASSDENQFKFKLASIIFNEGPIWEKKLEIQKSLQDMTLEEAAINAKTISNHAYNPGEEYDLDSDGVLQTINDQNVNKSVVSPVVAAQLVLQSLADVTTTFIAKFSSLFLRFVEPEEPLWYPTEGE